MCVVVLYCVFVVKWCSSSFMLFYSSAALDVYKVQLFVVCCVGCVLCCVLGVVWCVLCVVCCVLCVVCCVMCVVCCVLCVVSCVMRVLRCVCGELFGSLSVSYALLSVPSSARFVFCVLSCVLCEDVSYTHLAVPTNREV